MITTSSIASFTQHLVLKLSAVAVVLAGLGFAAYHYAWTPKVQAIVIKTGSMVQTIVASGRVESPHRISISAQITATVSEVPVTEGQFVQQGQTLIRLEQQEAQSALQQAQASVLQAQTNLRQLRELKAPVAAQNQRQAQANLVNAQNSLARSLELFGKGFIGAAAKDDAERAFEIAQAQLQIDLHQTASLQPGGSETALAEGALKQARAAVGAATARLRYSTIQAPKAGTLIDRNVEVGDGVQPGKLLMVLSPQGTTQLVLQIDEKNIKWLRLNQTAIASSDAFPDQKFQAELAYINPKVDPQRGSVEVKLNVLQPPANLKQDMTVSVDLETTRIENTVLVPLSAVHDIATPAPWVFVVQAGTAHKQALSLGLVSQGLAQVLAGVQAGDQVLPAEAKRIREGTRVRLVAP